VYHRSGQLTFSIGYAISRNRDLLRRLLTEHVTDATREQLAKRVVNYLELSGFEIDEGRQVMGKRPGSHGHGRAAILALLGAARSRPNCCQVLAPRCCWRQCRPPACT
jgi:hypothetical protein